MREGASLSRAGRRSACRREEEEEEGQWDPWRQMVVMAAATQTELKAKTCFHADPLILPLAMRTMRGNSLLVLSRQLSPLSFPSPDSVVGILVTTSSMPRWVGRGGVMAVDSRDILGTPLPEEDRGASGKERSPSAQCQWFRPMLQGEDSVGRDHCIQFGLGL